MLTVDRAVQTREQKRIARKYEILGYEVQERPDAGLLPDFMHDLTPDIIARSPFDNVVIEVKQRAALEGSNDLVGLAARVSGRSGWRFELVVVNDRDGTPVGDMAAEHDRLLAKVNSATQAGLTDLAYVYLAQALVEAAREIAASHRIKVKDKTDKSVFLDLGFRGVLPSALLDRCLEAIGGRDSFAAASGGDGRPSDAELKDLFDLYERLKQLS